MEEPTSGEKRPLQFSQMQSALITNAVLQGVMLMFTAAIFDSGFSSRMCAQAMVAYWLMTGWLVLRRGTALPTADALLIRVGFPLWLVVTVVVEVGVRMVFSGGV